MREGTEIKIRCLAGFSVIGSTLVTCQSDGKYSSIPECREIGENDYCTNILFMMTLCSHNLSRVRLQLSETSALSNLIDISVTAIQQTVRALCWIVAEFT